MKTAWKVILHLYKQYGTLSVYFTNHKLQQLGLYNRLHGQAMVDVDDSCQFSADSQPKSTGLV